MSKMVNSQQFPKTTSKSPPLLPSLEHNLNLLVTDPIPIHSDVDSRKQINPIKHSVPAKSSIENSHAARVRANCRRQIYYKLATNVAMPPEYPKHGMVLSVAAFSHYISGVGTTVLPPEYIIDDLFQWCEVCCMYFTKDNATSHKLAEDYNRRFENNQEEKNTDPDATSHKLGEDNNRECESNQKKKNADPFLRCEVCNIFFAKNDLLAEHTKGKKHIKKLKMLEKKETDIGTPAPTVPNATSHKLGEDNNRECESNQKKKNADPFLRCEVCDIFFTENDSLAWHKKGKKHIRKLKKLEKKETDIDTPVPTVLMPGPTKNTEVIQCERQKITEGNAKAVPETIKTNESEITRKKFRDGPRSISCEICNASIPNDDASIMVHNTGKKHLKELKKLEKKETNIGTPAPIVLIPGPTKNTEVIQGKIDSHALGVDSDNKKWKIIESTPAGIESIFSDDLESRKESNMEGDVEALPETTSEWEKVRIRLRDGRLVVCDICNAILRNDSAHIIRHNTGKKHLKEMTKLGKKETDTSTPATTLPMPGPSKNTEVIQDKTEEMTNETATESQVLGVDSDSKNWKIIESNVDGIEPTFSDDLENKKQSIMEGDLEALPENIKTDKLEGVRIKLKDGRLVLCEICNIILPNTSANIIAHNTGKKHLKLMTKLEKKEADTSTPAATLFRPVTTKNTEAIQGNNEVLKNGSATESQVPSVDSERKKRKITESDADGIDPVFSHDTENKRQKITEGNAEAVPESIKTNDSEIARNKLRAGPRFISCEISNVSSPNTDTDIIVHNTGKKHLKVLKKLEKKEIDTSALITTDLGPGLTKCPGAIQGETEGLKKGIVPESQVPRVDSENKKRKIIEGDAADGNRIDQVSCEVLENKKQKIMEGYAENNDLSEVLTEDYKKSVHENDPAKIKADYMENSEVCNIDCPSHTRKMRQRKVLKKKNKIAISTSASTHAPVTSGPLIIAEVSQVLKNENAIFTEPSSTEAPFLTGESVLVPELMKNQEACHAENEGLKNEIVIMAPDLQVISTGTTLSSTDAPVTIVLSPELVKIQELSHGEIDGLKDELVTESEAPERGVGDGEIGSPRRR